MRETAFKRSLKGAPLATEVKISSAAGSFTLHKNRGKPAVFLAGGIGVTPFLSIVRQAHRDRLPHKLYLFYSNRRPEDAPFLDTLQNLEKTNPNFHLICTMTEMSKSKKEWKGETPCRVRFYRNGQQQVFLCRIGISRTKGSTLRATP